MAKSTKRFGGWVLMFTAATVGLLWWLGQSNSTSPAESQPANQQSSNQQSSNEQSAGRSAAQSESATSPDGNASPGIETATVLWIVDGDTIDLSIGDESERVRLIGIDTPESVSRDTPVQCFGQEASEALRGLLPPGSAVRIVRDTEPRDQYGRLLLYVYREEDDLFVNRWLVENGFAQAISYRPNTSFEDEFRQLQIAAREANIGLWAACDGPDQPLQ